MRQHFDRQPTVRQLWRLLQSAALFTVIALCATPVAARLFGWGYGANCCVDRFQYYRCSFATDLCCNLCKYHGYYMPRNPYSGFYDMYSACCAPPWNVSSGFTFCYDGTQDYTCAERCYWHCLGKWSPEACPGKCWSGLRRRAAGSCPPAASEGHCEESSYPCQATSCNGPNCVGPAHPGGSPCGGGHNCRRHCGRPFSKMIYSNSLHMHCVSNPGHPSQVYQIIAGGSHCYAPAASGLVRPDVSRKRSELGSVTILSPQAELLQLRD